MSESWGEIEKIGEIPKIHSDFQDFRSKTVPKNLKNQCVFRANCGEKSKVPDHKNVFFVNHQARR